MLDENVEISEAWDNGWRRGVFDKCNGMPERNFNGCETNVYNRIYIDGYTDAFSSNEVRI